MKSRLLSAALIVCLLCTATANAAPQAPSSRAATLARGINMTRWFSAPYVQSMDHYAHYVSPDVLKQIKSAGFTYVRILVAPLAMQQADGKINANVAKALVEQMAAIQHAGLGVAIVPDRKKWQLDKSPQDQELLKQFWDQLAPMLASLDPNLTFPEILSEPNFPNDSDWDALQLPVYKIIRGHLPNVTLIATGNHWSDVAHLPNVRLLPDKNVVYTFHFYEPNFLTSTSQRDVPAQDLRVFSSLVFPVGDPAACASVSQLAQTAQTQGQAKWYCKSAWTAAKIRAEIHGVGEWARRNGVAAANGEFGILNDRPTPTRLAYIRAVREACEAEGLGWDLWGYDDGFGFGIPLDKAGPQPFDPAILGALGLVAH